MESNYFTYNADKRRLTFFKKGKAVGGMVGKKAEQTYNAFFKVYFKIGKEAAHAN